MKRMQCLGFKISERKDGSYKIHLNDGYAEYDKVCKTFREAGSWVWNMANNHDHARIVNERMCEVFGKDFA